MRSRAAILHDMGQQWSVEDFELDPPRAGEVLVEMAAAGLCHSDEHIRNGDMSAPNEVMAAYGLPSMFPMIGGHEGSGVVIEVGDGVTEFAPGDHVVTSFVAVCGRCRWCNSGMEYICDMGAQVMIPGMPTDGTFRHHTADGRNLGHLSKVGAFAKHTVVSTDSIVKVDPRPAAAADRAAVVRDSDRIRLRGEPRQGQNRRHRRRHRRRGHRHRRHSGRAHQRRGADHRGRSGGVQAEVRIGVRCDACVPTTAEATALVRDLTSGVMADSVVVSPALICGDDVQAALSLTRKGGTCVLTGMTARRRVPSRSTCKSSSCGTRTWSARCTGRAIRESTSPASPASTGGTAAARRDDHPALSAR